MARQLILLTAPLAPASEFYGIAPLMAAHTQLYSELRTRFRDSKYHICGSVAEALKTYPAAFPEMIPEPNQLDRSAEAMFIKVKTLYDDMAAITQKMAPIVRAAAEEREWWDALEPSWQEEATKAIEELSANSWPRNSFPRETIENLIGFAAKLNLQGLLQNETISRSSLANGFCWLLDPDTENAAIPDKPDRYMEPPIRKIIGYHGNGIKDLCALLDDRWQKRQAFYFGYDIEQLLHQLVGYDFQPRMISRELFERLFQSPIRARCEWDEHYDYESFTRTYPDIWQMATDNSPYKKLEVALADADLSITHIPRCNTQGLISDGLYESWHLHLADDTPPQNTEKIAGLLDDLRRSAPAPLGRIITNPAGHEITIIDSRNRTNQEDFYSECKPNPLVSALELWHQRLEREAPQARLAPKDA